MLAIQTSIFLLVVSLGLLARFRDATSLFRTPGVLVRSLGAMNVAMPCFAVILALTFQLRPVVAVVLIAVALAPVPPFLPMKTAKVGGDPSYAVSLLTSAAVLSLVLIPLGLGTIQAITDIEVHLDMAGLIKTLLLTVLLPLVVGMASRWLFPAIAARAAKPLRMAAVALLVATVPILFFGARHTILSLVGDGTLLAMAVLVAVGLAIGHVLGGPAPADRRVLAIATATRHPGVAVGLAATNYADDKLVVAAVLLYMVVASVVTLPYIMLGKRRMATTRDAGGPGIANARTAGR
jgi:BASS family bile acid:Na+ symporter